MCTIWRLIWVFFLCILYMLKQLNVTFQICILSPQLTHTNMSTTWMVVSTCTWQLNVTFKNLVTLYFTTIHTRTNIYMYTCIVVDSSDVFLSMQHEQDDICIHVGISSGGCEQAFHMGISSWRMVKGVAGGLLLEKSEDGQSAVHMHKLSVS